MNTEQRSSSWYEQRRGRFTGSRINELLGVRGLNKTGENYAFEMATQFFTGCSEEDSYMSKDMQRGVELEPLAFKKFKELKELEFLTVKNCGFFKYKENGGASPDGIVSDNAVLEIKCPKKETFFKVVATNKIDPKYYAQMQMEMLSADKSKAYFFNYYVQDGEEFWHEIIVERDEEMIRKIKERIKEASIVRDKYINEINNNKQF